MENDHEQMQGAFRNTSRSKFCGLANKPHIEQGHGLGTANCAFFSRVWSIYYEFPLGHTNYITKPA